HEPVAALAGGTVVMDELTEGGLRLGHADDVGEHRPHIPRLTDRRALPFLCIQLTHQVERASELGLSQHHGLVVVDLGDGGHIGGYRRLLGRRSSSTWSVYMSTTWSIRRSQRSPPGSLAVCWADNPATSAV